MFDAWCSISPCSLASEQQWVGFKGHGAICGGRSFGQDQTDQLVQATVARNRIAALKQAGCETQKAREEELGEGERGKCPGAVKGKRTNKNSV